MTLKNTHIIRIVRKLLLLSLVFSCAITQAQTTIKGTKIFNSQQPSFTGTKAVIVGISEYMNIRSLNFAHTDALSFYNYLVSDAGGNVDSTNIELLLNKKATSANIYAALNWLVDEAKEGERIIIYFSGHGDFESITIRQNGYLLGYDSPKYSYAAGGTIDIRLLKDYLETIVQKNKSNVLLITDACRSGKLAGGLEGAQYTTAALAQNWKNITKILSSQAGELSLESDKWGNGAGVFTYYLLNGLTGLADKNNNKEVTTYELASYLNENIPRETNYKQFPILDGDMTRTLALVDSLSLASVRKNNESISPEIYASRGGGNRYEKELDATTLAQYTKFRYCLENDLLIPEYSIGENAWNYYQYIIENKEAETIHKHIKRSLIAALQNKSQIEINKYLDSPNVNTSYSLLRALKELNYAYDLLSPNYILYNDIKARYLFFQSLLPQTSENTAILLLEQAIKLMPEAAYLYNWQALKYINLKQYIDALTLLMKAKDLAPTWPLIYDNLANVSYKLRQYEKAVEYNLQAIKLSPDFSEAYYNNGIVYNKLEQYDKAIEACQKAIDLEPGHFWACHCLIEAYEKQENYDAAIEFYLKAIELKPEESWLYFNLANGYRKLRLYNKVIESYLKYIDLKPDDPDPYYYLGNAYYHLKEYNKAIESYQRNIEINPNNSNAFYNLGFNYSMLGQYNKAIEACLIAIELKPDFYSAYNHLVYAYGMLKQYSLSVEFSLKAIKLRPDISEAYINLCTTYINLGQYSNAILNYKKVLDFDAKNIESYSGIGYCYSELNNFQKALEAYKKVIVLDPNNPEHYYNILCVYSTQNNNSEAIIWLQKALKKGYNNWKQLDKDADLDSIRNLTEYKELIKKYKNHN